MKLVCTQSDLSNNLSLVSRAVPSRPTQPVLANVRLVADEQTQTLSLTAFDLSLGIRTTFSATVEESGDITLPAKLLNDIVSRLPGGEITLTDETGVAVATLICATGRYQVRGMGSEDFPELPLIEGGEVLELPSNLLIEGLRGTLLATSADETKQVLTGVHLTVQNDTLEFAATDGHRLAVVKTAKAEALDPTSSHAFEVTVPARALRELEKMVGMHKEDSEITLHFDQGQVIFELPQQRLTARTLDGQYPAYNQLIPNQFQRQVTLDRRQLISAVERIAVLADQKNNIVKFSLDAENQQLTLSVDAADVGSGKESLSAEISGESLDIAFNVKYLVEGLKAIPSSELQMQLNAPTTPVILSPIGAVQMTYLIMPVQLRS
ncbi:DNA polymerase III subunit beta [Desertifilum sp. FACHB-1129]|uniref:Beta sliding clamp n=1 Tax=Desertifilum tharense IPPAS B-1220 TaxID=1781255 RepID=A0A1E5QFJ5_9CYAN|nr:MULTISPECIES: DNA polymerase III subunit beta [Desertifilum]MCD8486671.1 DNA polymerase III subunit beta [Desertifilum sp.]MDA0213521.1 DNA polymerase III subunit beta [Cyanobacteria bacterium FC1]MBD2311263.1 DNA polymerase III subunit beta [Desertifilum sp. FACHB-1129]MBD2321508.1 DNA polymerase III subunit beta [Desertifilum sp. FACHB-866]MBD2331635.1 DNA polymerase III subunit beta [Desertifilum sp. FACHB-868]